MVKVKVCIPVNGNDVCKLELRSLDLKLATNDHWPITSNYSRLYINLIAVGVTRRRSDKCLD